MLRLDVRGGERPLSKDMHAGSPLHTFPQLVLEAVALTRRTRLRIPLLIAEDCIHGHTFWEGATAFPTQLGMAATWDPGLVDRVARATAAEAADRIGLVGEGRSTATLELVGAQIALLDVLAATATPMTVAVISSKPLVLPESALGAAALVHAANPGMQGGRAIAELLLGPVEPSGRLPVSYARHAGQRPTFYNQVRGRHGDRYANLTQRPAFVFGEGLSYTTVAYFDLVICETAPGVGDTVRAEVTATNTGGRPAVETVQAYVCDMITSVTWAGRELKAYRRAEPGDFELRVGPSSQEEDLLRASFTVHARPGTGGAAARAVPGGGQPTGSGARVRPRIRGSRPLRCSHQSAINVNRGGTEAARASRVGHTPQRRWTAETRQTRT